MLFREIITFCSEKRKILVNGNLQSWGMFTHMVNKGTAGFEGLMWLF